MKEIRRGIRKLLEINENEYTIYQILWEKVKAILREKFVAMNAYIRKAERSQVRKLTIHLKELEKQEQLNPKLVEEKK
jgi:hypothetical protein